MAWLGEAATTLTIDDSALVRGCKDFAQKFEHPQTADEGDGQNCTQSNPPL